MRVWNRKATASTPLFATEGPRPEDVRMLPGRNDCYLLAAAQAVAARHPQILTANIREVVDGVLIHSGGDVGPALFSGNLADWQGGTPVVTWPAAVEAGYAYTHGGSAVLQRPGEPSEALQWLTGVSASTHAVRVGHRGLAKELAELWSRGECVVLHTRKHALALIGVEAGLRGPILKLMDPKPAWWQRSGVRVTTWNGLNRWRRIVAYSATLGAGARVPALASPGC